MSERYSYIFYDSQKAAKCEAQRQAKREVQDKREAQAKREAQRQVRREAYAETKRKKIDSQVKGRSKNSESLERLEKPKRHEGPLRGKKLILAFLAVFIAGGAIGHGVSGCEEHSVEKPKTSISRSVTSENLKDIKGLSQKVYEAFLQNENYRDWLKQNKPVYKKAEEKTGVDWKIIAAIHYREAGLNPQRSSVSGEMLGEINPDQHKRYSSLEESTQETAKFFKEKLLSVYECKYSLDDETLKKGFLAYNRGKGYKALYVSPESSPYVMNFYNKAYENMHWPKIPAEPSNIRGKSDSQLGAFTVYKILERAEKEGKI